MTEYNRLSAELRRLREDAGFSGRQVAAQTEFSQSRISRIERGEFMPGEAEVRALCTFYRAPAALRRELVRVAETIRAESAPARVVLQRGAWRMQERIARVEEASARIRSFQPVIIAGLLQTTEYMSKVFGPSSPAEDELNEVVNARAARQRLLDSGREFTFLISEGALRWNLGGRKVMVPQLEYLAEVTRIPHIRLGIISSAKPAPMPPLHSFHVYDARAVVVGTLTATAFITDERDVLDYQDAFRKLEQVAEFDSTARDIIGRVVQEFRSTA